MANAGPFSCKSKIEMNSHPSQRNSATERIRLSRGGLQFDALQNADRAMILLCRFPLVWIVLPLTHSAFSKITDHYSEAAAPNKSDNLGALLELFC